MKTPEEWMDDNGIINIYCDVPCNVTTKKAIKAYHEYAMKAVIEELKEIKVDKDYDLEYRAGVLRAIEIIKSKQ